MGCEEVGMLNLRNCKRRALVSGMIHSPRCRLLVNNLIFLYLILSVRLVKVWATSHGKVATSP